MCSQIGLYKGYSTSRPDVHSEGGKRPFSSSGRVIHLEVVNRTFCAYGGFSFCLPSCIINFSRTEQNIVAGDKLSPGTNPGFFKSEENVKLTIFYTQKCIKRTFYISRTDGHL